MAIPKVLCFEKINWELAGSPGRGIGFTKEQSILIPTEGWLWQGKENVYGAWGGNKREQGEYENETGDWSRH